MARRRKQEEAGPAGFLVVDKPPGWTSHDAVDAARRWLGTRRVGHLGTLDPQATGVLPLAVRAATKLVPFIEDTDKEYVGTVRFGVETDTLDAEGTRARAATTVRSPIEATLVEALAGVRRRHRADPAHVQRGQAARRVPLHRLARRGEVVERAPKKVRIHALRPALASNPPDVEIGGGVLCGHLRPRPWRRISVPAARLRRPPGRACGGLRSGPFRI